MFLTHCSMKERIHNSCVYAVFPTLLSMIISAHFDLLYSLESILCVYLFSAAALFIWSMPEEKYLRDFYAYARDFSIPMNAIATGIGAITCLFGGWQFGIVIYILVFGMFNAICGPALLVGIIIRRMRRAR